MATRKRKKTTKRAPPRSVAEVKVTEWGKLIEALYGKDFDESLKRHRSKWVYRGASRVSYDLKPSLMRIGDHYAEVENLILNKFKQYARARANVGTSEWNWLSIAQHNRLPTRLLDWTYSPYVALHFATGALGPGAPTHDAVVWCVNYARTNRLLSDHFVHALDEGWTRVFSVEMLDKAAPTLADFDKHDPTGEFVVFVEPPSIDERIVNQVALFSVVSRPPRSGIMRRNPIGELDKVLIKHRMNSPEFIRKVIIDKSLLWKVRDRLDQANVTERVLFPGLDGLSTWLKRYYTAR